MLNAQHSFRRLGANTNDLFVAYGDESGVRACAADAMNIFARGIGNIHSPLRARLRKIGSESGGKFQRRFGNGSAAG